MDRARSIDRFGDGSVLECVEDLGMTTAKFDGLVR